MGIDYITPAVADSLADDIMESVTAWLGWSVFAGPTDQDRAHEEVAELIYALALAVEEGRLATWLEATNE